MGTLPIVRSHERMDWKRCQAKWFYKWRKGLTPKEVQFGPLDLGTWMHDALKLWYQVGTTRHGDLSKHVSMFASEAIKDAASRGAPEHILDRAEELWTLGERMADAYMTYYGDDPDVQVLAAEIPLEFSFSDPASKRIVAIHRLKPDLVYIDMRTGFVWLMEHKTASQFRTEHLVIDDQARPYGVMAERALRRAGVLTPDMSFKGITYNILRKALPDERPTDAQGRALNKNGTVSKRQPAPLFLRHPVRLTSKSKVTALRRLQSETLLITLVAQRLREGRIDPRDLTKTPTHSCPRFCQYFAICTAEEEGSDTRDMERFMFDRRDPYAYDLESTEDITSFEMG